LFLWESDINILTFIPSSLKIPDEIAYKISQKIKIPLKNIISKKNNQESKNLSLKEQSFDKYEINFDKINKNDIFLVIDDVVGTGATFCEIMYKLYYFNKKVNYFLAVVKDVKR
jgi:predicted amidophosphoribosyltransferase